MRPTAFSILERWSSELIAPSRWNSFSNLTMQRDIIEKRLLAPPLIESELICASPTGRAATAAWADEDGADQSIGWPRSFSTNNRTLSSAETACRAWSTSAASSTVIATTITSAASGSMNPC